MIHLILKLIIPTLKRKKKLFISQTIKLPLKRTLFITSTNSLLQDIRIHRMCSTGALILVAPIQSHATKI